MKRAMLVAVMLSLASLTAGCPQLSASFVAGERQEFNAARPYLIQYGVEHPLEQWRISDNLASWDAKLSAAEREVGLVVPPASQPSTQPSK